MMDIASTTAPDSTQVNAEDFLAGARTVTITGVRAGSTEQPVEIELAEYPGRVYRPGKSMRRVLVSAWGSDASKYTGRRMKLFCDPTVKWGGLNVGGIRISHLSHIDKKLSLALTVTRGKRAMFTVDPLPNEAPRSSGMDEFNADTTTWRDPGPLITPAQSKQLFAALNDAGLGDKAAALTFISGQIGREIETSKELTVDEAPRVIAALAAITDPADTDAPTLDGSPA